MKAVKLFQYAYLFFAVLFIYDAISNWSTDRSRAYISLGFTGLAIFMYFFRKKFNKKFEDKNNAE